MDKNVALPASILVGCAMIGAGLYFGLSTAPAAPARDGKASSSLTAATGGAPPAEAAPAAAPPAAPAVVQSVAEAKAKEDATAALEKQRAALVERCWKPAVAKAPEPSRSKYLYQLSFSADGTPIARGISELRGESRSDVAQCLRSLPMDLAVPAPGAVVSVEIDFSMP